MTTLRIKLCGINNIDMASLNSVLQLSDSRLNSEWQVSQSGQVDLFIYSLDTEEGRSMLRQHRRGVSAALAQKNQTNALANFIIKKPIRTKQLVEVLNAAEEQIKVTAAEQTEKPPAPKTISSPKKAKPKTKTVDETIHKPAKKTSFLGSISKHLSRRKSPVSDLPALALYVPPESDTKLTTISEAKALTKWIKTLPKDDDKANIDALLEKLIPLNRVAMAAENRLALLELYREPINDFVFNRDIEAVKLEMSDPAVFKAKVKQLNTFIEELALGYKLVIMQAYQQGLRPRLNTPFLFAIIRATESISLLMIHAFRHYRSSPTGAVHELHQLYLYCETDGVLDKLASLKFSSTKKPFIHYYSQIMLTGIADPYSLDKYDVFRLFNLMAKMADRVAITPLTDHQKTTDNTTVLAGHFCLECHSDRMSIPLHHINLEQRQQTDVRLLNPQGVLFAIEQIFDAAANTSTLGRYNLDIQLLKKVIPQFNANFQRQYQRQSDSEERLVRLANGFEAIHYSLAHSDDNQTTEWSVCNHSSTGLMARCSKTNLPDLSIGDFLGVFEADLPPKLATIRWLQIDNNESVDLGLQLHPGNPAAISLSPHGKTTETKGLHLPPIEEIRQAQTIIVGKGGYSPNRTFDVKDDEKTYTIVTQKLLNYSLNYEQFNYVVKKD